MDGAAEGAPGHCTFLTTKPSLLFHVRFNSISIERHYLRRNKTHQTITLPDAMSRANSCCNCIELHIFGTTLNMPWVVTGLLLPEAIKLVSSDHGLGVEANTNEFRNPAPSPDILSIGWCFDALKKATLQVSPHCNSCFIIAWLEVCLSVSAMLAHRPACFVKLTVLSLHSQNSVTDDQWMLHLCGNLGLSRFC
jgi:hypothetical protein